jgi:hypothetical protein
MAGLWHFWFEGKSQNFNIDLTKIFQALPEGTKALHKKLQTS